MRTKILVTGGAGFIGSHTAVLLLDCGYDVLIFDNLSNSKASVIDRVERIAGRRPDFVTGDILDADALAELFQRHDFGAVVHFAGLKAVGESVSQPLRYYETNISGSLKLYAAMEKAGVKTLIYSSSATVYGSDGMPPYKENSALGASNPYGWTKLMNEQILRDICAADDEWSAVLLRYFNPGGAHPSGLIGEDPNGIPNNLLPYAALVAAGRLERLNIFGDDYDTPDGTGVRDYIHVMDLARGHVLALEWAEARRAGGGVGTGTGVGTGRGTVTGTGTGVGTGTGTGTGVGTGRGSLTGSGAGRAAGAGIGAQAVNLGTGKGTSVREIAAAFGRACGHELPVVTAPRRAGDLPSVYADAGLAKSLFGFEACLGIDDICTDAWRWQQYAAGLAEE